VLARDRGFGKMNFIGHFGRLQSHNIKNVTDKRIRESFFSCTIAPNHPVLSKSFC